MKHVIVFGQRNKAAETCLACAMEHLSADGRRVEEWLPAEHDDWSDALRDRLMRNAHPRADVRRSTVMGFALVERYRSLLRTTDYEPIGAAEATRACS